LHHGVPPVLGALLRPLRARHLHVFMERGISRADAAALIHQKRARTTGANVYAKPHVDMVSTLGTDKTGMDSRRSLPEIRWQSCLLGWAFRPRKLMKNCHADFIATHARPRD